MVVTMNCPMGFPGGSDGKESVCNARRPEFDPLVRKIPWKREWLPTPVFLPGESCGQRSLAGCNPRSQKESDTTEHTAHTHTHILLLLIWDQVLAV